MGSFFGMIQTMLVCGTIVGLAVIVLLAMPECKLRAFLLPIVGWVVAILCGIYCISPIDIVPEALLGPFGLVDDLGSLVAGFAAARMAMTAGKEAEKESETESE